MEQKTSKKEPIYVAFSTQKGGAGKTTLTVLSASYLHYELGYNVAIIDCDFPQHSIYSMRQCDLKMAMEDEFYRGMAYEQFTRLDKKAYPIVESDTGKAITDAEEVVEDYDTEFDIIFFDLPGTLNNRDLVHTLAHMDYIIAPIAASRVVMESTLDYMISVRDNIVASGKSNIKAMFLSTLFPPDKTLMKGSNVDTMTDELLFKNR
jgi:cellulose biosynthesis protein BcsQ